MRHNSTENWTKVLQDVLTAHNDTPHSRLGITPNEAIKTDSAKLYRKLYGDKAAKGPKPAKTKRDLKVGQKVRISKTRWPFAKGYWGGWTLEHFAVD